MILTRVYDGWNDNLGRGRSQARPALIEWLVLSFEFIDPVLFVKPNCQIIVSASLDSFLRSALWADYFALLPSSDNVADSFFPDV